MVRAQISINFHEHGLFASRRSDSAADDKCQHVKQPTSEWISVVPAYTALFNYFQSLNGGGTY